MGEKQNKNNDGEKKNGKKNEKANITVVLKVEMHCEGCASKMIRCVKAFEGVETVKAEWDANKLTVIGVVDPLKIQEKLATKTKKKVDLVSPQLKNDSKGGDNQKKKDDKKPEEKKSKEAAVTTAILKLDLHCQGCVEKIHKLVSKTKGVREMSIDRENNLVTVKGAMDGKDLAKALNEKLKRPVEVIPAKKEKDGNDKKDGDGKKAKGGGGVEKKLKGDSGEDGKTEENGGAIMEWTRMENVGAPVLQFGYGLGNAQGYIPGYLEQVHAPQMFSDENPNACAIM